ncbi:hypothetical protein GCM10011579_006080 [Streptomyces albiflavescens]|uniref:Uncharacterized protein n=1 Tax=Streptomyces albiflavescens TaxID=1623582 RepID=A0A917XTP9_9ACTN|nr:hypothetical protein GCM10011579_006080 [Streptomyces albiflavescens]
MGGTVSVRSGRAERPWRARTLHGRVADKAFLRSTWKFFYQKVKGALLMERDAEGGRGRGQIRVPGRADRLAVER